MANDTMQRYNKLVENVEIVADATDINRMQETGASKVPHELSAPKVGPVASLLVYDIINSNAESNGKVTYRINLLYNDK